MEMYPRVITTLKRMTDKDAELSKELKDCIKEANWTPPGWEKPISTFEDFYRYLDQLMNSTPLESTFDNLFHGIYHIISQNDNQLQNNPKFFVFREWLALFTEQYGCFMNTPKSANNLYSFISNKTFALDDFQIPFGGFNSFNAFFSRYIKPGKRPIGAKTHPYEHPSEGHPVGPNPPDEDIRLIHENMCDDRIITVPADSVYEGC